MKRGEAGLSVKILGESRYRAELRIYKKTHGLLRSEATVQPRWTGLSDKALGHACYVRLWRQKRAQRNLLTPWKTVRKSKRQRELAGF